MLSVRRTQNPASFARFVTDNAHFIFDEYFGLFGAIGFRADEKRTDCRSGIDDVLYCLETGGWLGALLGVVQLGRSVSNALASLLQPMIRK